MRYFVFALAIVASLYASSARSQTFTTLVAFTGSGGTASGANPDGSLIASGGMLYGMTQHGGYDNVGNVFSVEMNGTNYQNLVSFTGSGGTASGNQPYGSLIASGGALYGMTLYGDGYGDGNIFSVGTNGTNYQNLVTFTASFGTVSGASPYGSLIASGGTLYGMTQHGGANNDGTVFSVGTDGTSYRNLVSFTGTGGTASGADPEGSLIAIGGTLYGMAVNAGPTTSSYGTVFSVGTNGTNYQNLVSFTGTGGLASGEFPYGSLLASGSTLYGMTFGGGADGDGNIFSVGVNGTNYQNLASFTGTSGSANGRWPLGSLILSGTALYGMTQYGGVYHEGNIFSVGINGSGYQDLYDFTGGTDGLQPHGDLLASGGTLFGMTYSAGANGAGTVFALVIPEPGTLALAGAGGAAALVSYRWRRRARRKRRG